MQLPLLAAGMWRKLERSGFLWRSGFHSAPEQTAFGVDLIWVWTPRSQFERESLRASERVERWTMALFLFRIDHLSLVIHLNFHFISAGSINFEMLPS